MPREKEDFRDNLELISGLFPNRVNLDLKECCEVTGCDRRTLSEDKAFPTQKLGGKIIVPIVALARWLS